ncbi:hypothetical protein V2O64_17630 [Verrucomicrobiaceae bacterium 227]
MKNAALWNKLQAFSFDLPEANFSFSKRLARENNWTETYTGSVIEEYRRFLYLCVEAGHQVTPSDDVDQAWHLHLCYTRSYWEDLCRDTLGHSIHHGPTKGGSREHSKFSDWYSRTLASYQREFHTPPPSRIWPAPTTRFAPRNFQRVDTNSNLVVSKRKLVLGLTVVGGAIALTGCSNNEGSAFGIFFFVFIIAVAYSIIKKGGKGGGKGGGSGHGCSAGGSSSGWFLWGGNDSGSDSSDGGSSGCSSGCGGGGCGGGCSS